MSYAALVGKQLTLAFQLSKSLAVDVVFLGTGKAPAEFDFSTGTVPPTKDTPQVYAKAIPSKFSRTTTGETMNLLVSAPEAATLHHYATVQVDLVNWQVVSKITSNRYTALLSLSRTI